MNIHEADSQRTANMSGCIGLAGAACELVSKGLYRMSVCMPASSGQKGAREVKGCVCVRVADQFQCYVILDPCK